MELLDGLDLENLVALDGPQPAARVIHILRQAARALDGAHNLGLIHRDVKPANMFLCRTWGEADAVKVLDFGLAKDMVATVSKDLSASGAILGTPLYIAPETLIGSPAPDARADLYSLGAVAYKLLTGDPVFKGRSAMEICGHHLHTPPVAPSKAGFDVPADLEAVLMSCLAKDRGDRYASARALDAALAACADAGGWTSSDAASWWNERRGKIERWRAEQPRMAAADTVQIDAAAREPGPGP
jgi:serine/threonine-protein kinase